jgi:hypothetical protein
MAGLSGSWTNMKASTINPNIPQPLACSIQKSASCEIVRRSARMSMSGLAAGSV